MPQHMVLRPDSNFLIRREEMTCIDILTLFLHLVSIYVLNGFQLVLFLIFADCKLHAYFPTPKDNFPGYDLNFPGYQVKSLDTLIIIYVIKLIVLAVRDYTPSGGLLLVGKYVHALFS